MDVEAFQDHLKRWGSLEREARAAEQRLTEAGQLGASPEAASLAKEAAEKRRIADDCLSLLRGTTRTQQVPASNDPDQWPG